MKKSLTLLTVCLLMTVSAFASNCCCEFCQAYVSLKLDPDSKARTLTPDKNLLYNSISTNAENMFELDKKSGTLTLNKTGTYTVSFDQLVQNTSTESLNIGVYATLNDKIIPTSGSYRKVSPQALFGIANIITFNAKCGDTFNIRANFTPINGQGFQIPVGPDKAEGLNGPITKVDWSPNFYEIIFVGN